MGEGGVGPGDAAALAKLVQGGIQQFGAAPFLIALWTEPGDDQLSSQGKAERFSDASAS